MVVEILGMKLATFIGLVAGLGGGIALFTVLTGLKQVGRANKNTALWASAAVTTIGSVLLLNLGGAGVALNTLSAGDSPNDNSDESCPAGFTLNSAGLCVQNGGAAPPPVAGKKNQEIDTLNVKVQEKGSNAWNVVGNSTAGSMLFYPSGVNPKDSNAKTVQNITVQSGEGSLSSSKLVTDIPYRTVFDGDSQWNDLDFGEVILTNIDFNPSTAGFLILIGNGAANSAFNKQVSKIASIADTISEAATDGSVNGETSTADTNAKVIARELVNTTSASATANRFMYNETQGDETFRIDLEHSYTGANSEVEQPVNCFEWDQTNPPEGTEVTKITVSHLSGDTFDIPSDVTNFWSNEDCILLADSASGGMLGKYRYTYTVDEATLDNGGDMWTMESDDLGAINGRSILNQKGAAKVTTRFESVSSTA